MKTYQRIVFCQGLDAIGPLRVLDENGPDSAVEYLAQWDSSDACEYYDEPASGESDSVVETDDGYRLSWNWELGYIGLEKVVEGEQP